MSSLLSVVALTFSNPELFESHLLSQQVISFVVAYAAVFVCWEIAAWLTRDWLVRDMFDRHRDNGSDG